MLFDQLLSTHNVRLPEQFGLWHVGASLLAAGFIALVVDYAYMLYMRSKLVSASRRLHPSRLIQKTLLIKCVASRPASLARGR